MVHALLLHSSDTFNKLHVHSTIKSGPVMMEVNLAFIVEERRSPSPTVILPVV